MTNQDPIDFEEIEGEIEVTSPETYAGHLVEWATDRHASDLFLSDDQRSVVIAVRVMGRIEIVRRLARDYGNRLQGHFRAIAGANAGDLVHPTEGRAVLATEDGREVDFRLSAIPTLFGQDVSIRLFDSSRSQQGIHGLGLDDAEVEMLKRLLDHPSGLILVSGPVASGKTCTLYSALHYLNDGSRKIHTIEDPVEYAIRGVHQSQVNLRARLDYNDLLTAVLRHSPDVIMIGEIRDASIAATAVRAGSSGQLVLATVHSDSAAQAISIMRQYEANSSFLARTLVGVVNQRLVKRLCPECREEIACGDELIGNERVRQRLAGTPPKLYRAGSGDACFNTGFDSLTCLPELLYVTPEIERAIVEGESAMELERLATEGGMLTLADTAEARILQGVTTPAEICRELDAPQLAHLIARYRDAERSE